MPSGEGRESCGCVDRLTAAARRRAAAAEAERLAVDELHDAIVDAYDAPSCMHSRRELGRLAGMTQGGIQNVLAGAGAVRST